MLVNFIHSVGDQDIEVLRRLTLEGQACIAQRQLNRRLAVLEKGEVAIGDGDYVRVDVVDAVNVVLRAVDIEIHAGATDVAGHRRALVPLAAGRRRRRPAARHLRAAAGPRGDGRPLQRLRRNGEQSRERVRKPDLPQYLMAIRQKLHG